MPTSLYSYSLREQFTDRHVILTSCQPVFALTHWENSSQINMLSWLRANQSLLSNSLREQFTDRHVILTSCHSVFALTCYPDFVSTSLCSNSLREQFTDRHCILTSCQPVFALTHWENSSQIDMLSWLRANQSLLLITERTLHRETCYPDFVPTSLCSYSMREQFTDRHVILTSCQPVFARTHWENSSQIDMLSWLRANQSLLLLTERTVHR